MNEYIEEVEEDKKTYSFIPTDAEKAFAYIILSLFKPSVAADIFLEKFIHRAEVEEYSYSEVKEAIRNRFCSWSADERYAAYDIIQGNKAEISATYAKFYEACPLFDQGSEIRELQTDILSPDIKIGEKLRIRKRAREMKAEHYRVKETEEPPNKHEGSYNWQSNEDIYDPDKDYTNESETEDVSET